MRTKDYMNSFSESSDQLTLKGRKQGYLFFEDVRETFQNNSNDGDGFDGALRFMDDSGIKLFDKNTKISSERGESGKKQTRNNRRY